MKEEIKRILNELKTSKYIETLKLDELDIDDYRDKGYYVLYPSGAYEPFGGPRSDKKYLCYISKKSEPLEDKKNNMKDPDSYNLIEPF